MEISTENLRYTGYYFKYYLAWEYTTINFGIHKLASDYAISGINCRDARFIKKPDSRALELEF